jgi:hypothetical protein
MCRAGWVGAAKEMVVRFVSATLRWTPWGVRFLEAELLNLERKDFVDPFRKAFLLREGEGEKCRADDVPMNGIEESGKRPIMVFAEVRSLLLGGVESSDLRRDVVCNGRSIDGE